MKRYGELPAIALTAILLLAAEVWCAGCFHRAPKPVTAPCCCVLGDHERSESDYCDPADCERHHGEVD